MVARAGESDDRHLTNDDGLSIFLSIYLSLYLSRLCREMVARAGESDDRHLTNDDGLWKRSISQHEKKNFYARLSNAGENFFQSKLANVCVSKQQV